MRSSGSMGTMCPIVLVMFVALLVASLAATAGADTIRLPSGGGSRTGAGGRPWKCCDFVVRRPAIRPPRWQCNDVVAECSANCHRCEPSPAGGDGYVCRDWITSMFEPPVCTPRPWDCCDNAVCTRQYIPYCWCGDKVESCPSNCKECELVESEDGRPRYRCLDRFHGYPGPKCTPWITKGN